ncbi:MAG: amidohydrolase family protein [Proteobacteria bacterium]|nr:amidohydrolase family protein [Pseudomonadota bacterium]
MNTNGTTNGKSNESGSRTLLKNGFIVDGTGRKGYSGDLLIEGDRIKEISKTPIEVECRTVDCAGLVVAPGFIDAHSHMDWILALKEYDQLKTPFTAQGVTTFVTGNCGYSPGGFRRNSPHKGMLSIGDRRGFDISWDTMAGYYDHLKEVGLTHNMVHLVGHGTTQVSIRGLNPKPLDQEEMKELIALLEEAMEQGAAGVSFGLGYEPGMFFDKDRIMEVARAVKKKEKIVTVHGRAYASVSGFYPRDDDNPHNVLSLQEMIDVARETGVRMQYSHLMFAGTKSHPTYRQCLDVLDQAIDDGIDVMIDTYPYHCGVSVINVILPPWFLANLPANYSDKEALARVEKGLDNMSRNVGFGYDDVQLTHAGDPEYSQYNGMFVDQIAEKTGKRSSQVVVELSEKNKGKARILNHNYSNMEIIDALIAHPACLFMTDSTVSTEGVQNPASFGSFPLILQYARDRNLIPLEQVVGKMTGATAERLNVKDRGILKEGLAADVTVFDWENVRDNNTVTETDRAPTGIEAVFVNGRQVKRNGTVDPTIKAGTVLRT